MQMLKSYYSAEEVLQLLNKKSSPNLSYKDLKDLCLRGKLTPAIYFEGNIVCIHEERSPNEIDARELGPHERSVSWTSIFKGYLHSRDFLDFLESSTVSNPKTDVFFRFEKIIECLESENEIKLLNQNEYLKAFSRMTDDDIRNIRWLIEAHHFEGNPFSSTDIVFHHQEVQRLLDPEQNETNLKFIDYSDNKFLSKVLKQLFYDPITAACLMTGDDPAQLEVLKAANQKLYEVKYPENFEALTLILRAIEMGILKANSDLIISEIPLKEFLVERGYIINGFNKIHYDGTYFPYHYDKKRFKQPIPLNLSECDPLSEINYLRFKVSKQKDEIEKLNFFKNSLSNNNSECFESKTYTDVGEYSTPALEAIKGVIIKYWVNYDPKFDVPPKQTTVMDWIKDNYPEFKENDYVKKAIDRLCRHPTAKLGGNSKVESDSKKKTSKQ